MIPAHGVVKQCRRSRECTAVVHVSLASSQDGVGMLHHTQLLTTSWVVGVIRPCCTAYLCASTK